MPFRIAIVCAFGLVASEMAAAQQAERPPVRFDNWLYLQHNIDGSDRWQYRPRFYIPFELPGGWTFTQRLDLPMYYTDKAGPQNTGGGWKAGIGDWFVEESFASPEIARNLKASGSVRLVFPTGGSGPLGSDQYQWAPSLGLIYAMPEQRITINPVARYFMSYHANRDGAGKVRRLDLYPTVTFGLSGGWSFALYPENAIDYNEVTRKWFVPIDALLTLRLDKTIELGFGGAYALVKDDPQFQYVINGRVTFRF